MKYTEHGTYEVTQLLAEAKEKRSNVEHTKDF